FESAPSQEASDLDKAVAFALEQGAAVIRILGAGGGRIDHTLANVSLLLKYGGGADIALVDERGLTRAVSGEAEFHGIIGDTLSLIPFGPCVVGWTEGLEWALRDEPILPGSRGVSNLFVENV